jgi:type IX secretion system PorP/SprF family membrane protein
MFLKLKTILIILFVDMSILLAQQVPFSNQYLVNRHFLSPAYAGITNNFEAFLTYQTNTFDFPGGPEYRSLYASGPVFQNMSLGVSVSKNSVTIFNAFSSQLYYAYHLKISEKQFIHFGLSFEYSENYLGSDNQPSSSQNDPYISKYGYSLNSGFGLIYTYKTFQMGVSIPRMLGSYIRSSNTTNQSGFYPVNYSIPRLLRIHASYLFDISNSLSLEPIVIVDQSDTEPLWYNVSTAIRYKEMSWLELHYQQGGIMGVSLGVSPTKKMLFNYTYEFSGSGLMKYSSGNHEISIGFLIGKNSDRKYQKSPFRSLSKQPYYDWVK